jgi:5-methylthioadenosine/S-adenosylhomocysteine deaminase
VSCDIAIVNGTVLPMGGRSDIESGIVAITGNSIAAVGDSRTDVSGAKKIIDARGAVVMPGFANSHTHVASNLLLRGLLEDVLLFEWLQIMWSLKRNFDHETLYWASLCGDLEMLKAGITSFNEHFDAYDVEPQMDALREIPLRATLGYGFADRGLYAPRTDYSLRTMARFADIVAEHHDTRDGLLHVALSPHAVYSCGAEMWHEVRRLADSLGVSIHTHLSEGKQEVAYTTETYGMRPVQWLDSLGFLGPDVTAAHCSSLDDRDIAILARTGTKVAHCPISNAKLGSGTMPLRAVMAAGITVGLATDGPASHNASDLFEEMKFAGLIHKTMTGDVEFLKIGEILESSTAQGALAMHRPDTGRLEVGAKADVIVVNLDTAHTQPVYDPRSALVYSSRADDVTHSIVNGRVLMENRVVAGVDEERVRHKFHEAAHALKQRSLG